MIDLQLYGWNEVLLKHQMPILKTSIHQPVSIQRLRECIARNETVVFIGSSGVGKSSLINRLCNKSVLSTSEISSSTQKGRHTSTRREMVLLDDWGVLIDTPGFREFGLAIHNSDLLLEPMKSRILRKNVVSVIAAIR
jgi:Predicted GTPases